MTFPVVETDRLELRVLTAEAIDAVCAADAERLRSLSDATFPWRPAPPPDIAEALPVVRDRLREEPAEAPWWNWLAIRRDTREAVGSVAFGGPPDPTGAVLVGYAMYPELEGQGFATEAVRAMIDWVFEQPGVTVVRALAPVWNTPAVRVAEKVGMRPVASDEDDEVGEVLVYELTR